MAWLDDRAWCHPKLVDLPKGTRWIWAASIMYSSGFGTRGFLSPGQQDQIGSTTQARKQLIAAGLWDDYPGGHIRIHDWDEHNDKRDERRASDRERKRTKRAAEKKARLSAGQSADTVRTRSGQTPGQDAEKSEDVRALKEVKEVKEVKGFSPDTSHDSRDPDEQPSIEEITPNLREIA